MKVELGFGLGTQAIEVKNLMGILEPNKVELEGRSEVDEVRHALAHPIGSPRLKDLVKKGQKVVIITSDLTRPMPTARIMPAVMEELDAAGLADEDITIVLAVGSHRMETDEEKKRLVGEAAFARYKVVDSNPNDCIHMGTTKRGTPVDVTRVVAEADFRICMGNVEYHYFAGYSGGGKALMPGVSSRDAIQHNHSHMVEPGAFAGKLEGNPIREDIEEAASIIGCDFIINVVLDEHKKVIKAVCGDKVAAHREGCRMVDALYLKPIEARADIVLVSQGGAPKDLNLYQTQKALDNAKHAVKDGGVVILIGSCKEGFGEKTFGEWLTSGETPDELVEHIRRDFKLGGHKAAAIALVKQKADIYLVSEMDEAMVKSTTCLTPYTNAQKAYDDALAKLGEGATTLVMPYGGSTLPRSMAD